MACCTAQKMKFSFKNFFSKCGQIRSFLLIWSHLPKKSLLEIFCAVLSLVLTQNLRYLSKKKNLTSFHHGNKLFEKQSLYTL